MGELCATKEEGPRKNTSGYEDTSAPPSLACAA